MDSSTNVYHMDDYRDVPFARPDLHSVEVALLEIDNEIMNMAKRCLALEADHKEMLQDITSLLEFKKVLQEDD